MKEIKEMSTQEAVASVAALKEQIETMAKQAYDIAYYHDIPLFLNFPDSKSVDMETDWEDSWNSSSIDC